MIRQRRQLVVALVVWTLFGIFTATDTYFVMISHGHSYLRLLTFQVVRWWVWVAFTPLVDRLRQRVRPASLGGVLLHGAAASALGALQVAATLSLALVLHPYDALGPQTFADAYLDMLSAGLPLQLLIYGATLAALEALAAQDRARRQEVEGLRLHRELAEARLEALRLQLHPHFLFNALHTIGGLVRAGEGTRAVNMIAALSDLLRHALDTTQAEIPLRQEMEIAGQYLRIESERFADRLRVRVDLAPEAADCLVPPLILQPLLENAIRHGIARLAEGGTVSLTARRERTMLTVEIANPAPSGTLPAVPGGGLGLANARRRLREHYGEEQTLEIDRQGDRVVVRLTAPWHLGQRVAS